MLIRASESAKAHREAANSMSKAWHKSAPGRRKLLLAYKQDKSKPNPFEEPDPGTSTYLCVWSLSQQHPDDVLDKLKDQLAREDSEQQGAGVSFPHKMTPAAFLQFALEVEAAQYVLFLLFQSLLTFGPRRILKTRGCENSEGDSSTFIERRRALTKNIDNLRDPQRLYMPGTSSHLSAADLILLADHPENVELWLPSALPSASRDTQCIAGLSKLEYRLRFAQAMTALHDIRLARRLLRILTTKSQTHITNTQRPGTRTCSVFDKAKAKLARAVSTYRTSRKAVVDLAPNEEFGLWKDTLRELKDGDIRGPGKEESGTSASRSAQSWIWTTGLQASSPGDSDLDIVLRVEWCKAQELAKRYEEEVQLVIEEMRRTLVTFKLNAHEWEQRATFSIPAVGDAAAAGITAYAYKQASIQRGLIKVFIKDWYDILTDRPHATPWLHDYSPPAENRRRRLVSNVQLYHSSSSPRVDTPHTINDVPPPSVDTMSLDVPANSSDFDD